MVNIVKPVPLQTEFEYFSFCHVFTSLYTSHSQSFNPPMAFLGILGPRKRAYNFIGFLPFFVDVFFYNWYVDNCSKETEMSIFLERHRLSNTSEILCCTSLSFYPNHQLFILNNGPSCHVCTLTKKWLHRCRFST